MDSFISRFPTISEQIFVQLDIDSLNNCLKVSKLWKNYINENNFLWIQYVSTLDLSSMAKPGYTLKTTNGGIYKIFFRLACRADSLKRVEWLLEKLDENTIDLYADFLSTSYLKCCMNNQLKIAEMLIQNSVEYKINLNITGDFF